MFFGRNHFGSPGHPPSVPICPSCPIIPCAEIPTVPGGHVQRFRPRISWWAPERPEPGGMRHEALRGPRLAAKVVGKTKGVAHVPGFPLRWVRTKPTVREVSEKLHITRSTFGRSSGFEKTDQLRSANGLEDKQCTLLMCLLIFNPKWNRGSPATSLNWLGAPRPLFNTASWSFLSKKPSSAWGSGVAYGFNQQR